VLVRGAAVRLPRGDEPAQGAAALPAGPDRSGLDDDYNVYRAFGEQVWEILAGFSPSPDLSGLDDAYLDLAGKERLNPDLSGVEMGRRLKSLVREAMGLTVTCGIGASRVIARMASASGKPDGLVFVPPGGEEAFLRDKPIEKLPGVGSATAEILRRLNVRTIGELAAKTVSVKIRGSDFIGDAVSRSLDAPSDQDDELYALARRIFGGLYTRRVSLRGVGVVLSGIRAAGDAQPDLFDPDRPGRARRAKLYRVLDEVRRRYGYSALIAGRAFELVDRLDKNDHGFVLRTPSLTK
jgi:nucleotidyltransferase/DNA polymerase involved in DNA repair